MRRFEKWSVQLSHSKVTLCCHIMVIITPMSHFCLQEESLSEHFKELLREQDRIQRGQTAAAVRSAELAVMAETAAAQLQERKQRGAVVDQLRATVNALSLAFDQRWGLEQQQQQMWDEGSQIGSRSKIGSCSKVHLMGPGMGVLASSGCCARRSRSMSRHIHAVCTRIQFDFMAFMPLLQHDVLVSEQDIRGEIRT